MKSFPQSMLTFFLFMRKKLRLILFGFYLLETIHSLNLGNIMICRLCQLSCTRHVLLLCPARLIRLFALYFKDKKGLFGTHFTILEKCTIQFLWRTKGLRNARANFENYQKTKESIKCGLICQFYRLSWTFVQFGTRISKAAHIKI